MVFESQTNKVKKDTQEAGKGQSYIAIFKV